MPFAFWATDPYRDYAPEWTAVLMALFFGIPAVFMLRSEWKSFKTYYGHMWGELKKPKLPYLWEFVRHSGIALAFLAVAAYGIVLAATEPPLYRCATRAAIAHAEQMHGRCTLPPDDGEPYDDGADHPPYTGGPG